MVVLRVLCVLSGLLVLFAVLLDALETVVLPRRVRRYFRLTSGFYQLTWKPWAAITRSIKTQGRREAFLGYFGPLSLIFLLALWAAGLIFGFALLQHGTGGHVTTLANGSPGFGLLLYHSGETFFTLGYGDIVPGSGLSRFLAVLEAGLGFAFLGIVVGYLPTIYAAFSRREIEISLLDARAGSPPSAAELLRRYCQCPPYDGLDQIFRAWERWSAEVLESHLSYPVLSFFRSQHNNQSWLAALTTILDATALVIVGVEGIRADQAKMTFAMARHAVVDLAQVVAAAFDPHLSDRLPSAELIRLRQVLSDKGLTLRDGDDAEQRLAALREMYEPYVEAIGRRLLIPLPPWIFPQRNPDNWQVAPWDQLIQNRGTSSPYRSDDHF
jgi:hypothetical protein